MPFDIMKNVSTPRNLFKKKRIHYEPRKVFTKPDVDPQQ